MNPRVALVTGGSRGVGRGIALELAAAGWTVYITGRTEDALNRVALEISDLGGTAVAAPCDHADDTKVRSVVEQIRSEQGRLDVLVNNVITLPDGMDSEQRFWERPLSDWDDFAAVGIRSHYITSALCAALMVEAGSGLIVNISAFASRGHFHSVPYAVSKAVLDKLAHSMGAELSGTGVVAVSLWPGLVRTEAVEATGLTEVFGFSISEAETPRFVGRVITRLADGADLAERNGHTYISAELGAEYQLVDENGVAPRSLREAFGGGALW